jgi:hypothetical protein
MGIESISVSISTFPFLLNNTAPFPPLKPQPPQYDVSVSRATRLVPAFRLHEVEEGTRANIGAIEEHYPPLIAGSQRRYEINVA